MKSSLSTGISAEIEVTVTRDMLAEFEGHAVHDLYATSALVHHIEAAAGKLLLPFLEENEQCVTSYLEISHMMLSVAGMNVKIKATLTEIRQNKIVCDIEATNVRGRMGKATLTQVIVDKTWLDNKVKEMSLINQLVSQAQVLAPV